MSASAKTILGDLPPSSSVTRFSVSAAAFEIARPARVRFVGVLPKTRSGKLLRRAIQAVCEGRDPGDLTTMDDPGALQQIRDLFA